MFELKEVTIDTFTNDEKIMLPRFQRKQTWQDKKNFELCISLYKDFPLGVVVINMEEDEGKFQKWLLDGRQRRNALTKMKNPEEIYKWAKSFIGFRVNDTSDDITQTFWDRLDEYLGEEIEDSDAEQTENEDQENLEDEENISESNFESIEGDETEPLTEVPSNPLTFKRGDLTRLLQIILTVHPIRGKQSGLTKPFNFSRFVEGLDYIKPDENGEDTVSTQDLLIWIDFQKAFRRHQEYPPTQELFFDWITQKNQFLRTEAALKREIARRWDQIINVFNVLESLNLQLKEGKIGYILLKGYNDDDARKIFHIINSGGTKLDPAEILSAKPSWNKPVINPSPDLVINVNELYQKMGVKQYDNVVKWDVAATLLNRINIEFII